MLGLEFGCIDHNVLTLIWPWHILHILGIEI